MAHLHPRSLGYPVSSRDWPSLPLFLDWGEHVVICTLCQYALPIEGAQASSHFRKKHQIPWRQRQGLDQYLHQHQFRSGSLARPRPNGSPRHSALRVLTGFQCRQCSYISTSLDLMSRHLMKTHFPDRPSPKSNLEILYATVSLQTWTQSTATQSYWVISSDHDAPDQVVNDKTPHGTANSNFLHDLRQRELRFQTADQYQNARTFTGTATHEGTRPWLDRTRWISTYQGIPCDVLQEEHTPQDCS